MSVKRRRGEAGTTLIELLAAMAIMTVISTMIILSWSAIQNSYSNTIKGAEARSTARDAMDRMRREIRAIQPLSGQTGITQAGANEIRFTTAFNDPGANGEGLIRLTRFWYDYDGSKTPDQWCIYRQRDTDNDGTFTGDPSTIIARNVVNGAVPSTADPTAVFRYLGSDGAETTDLAEIATVEVRVITDLNPQHSPTYFDLVTTVHPRNVGSD